MSAFDQYSGIAGGFADQYGVPRNVFFGMIQTESSWNPNASPGTSSAYGFTQLLRGTANDLGVNRFDPVQNLKGGAQYLGGLISKFGVRTGLAAYHDGAGAIGQHGGFSYADKVLNAAKSFMSGDTVQLATDGARCAAGDITGCVAAGSNFLGFGSSGSGGDSCGLNPICYLRQWLDSTHFMTRLALACLAFLFILGGLYLYKQAS